MPGYSHRRYHRPGRQTLNGGVLDRFDALLFGAVAAYFVTIWLVY